MLCWLNAGSWGAFVCPSRQGLLALGGDLLYAPFVNVTSLSTHTALHLGVVWNIMGAWVLALLNQEIRAELSPSSHMLYVKSILVIFLFCFMSRFLGATKISLRELSSGQVRSLPSRNVPLVNESGQNIGVSSCLWGLKIIRKKIFLNKHKKKP